MDELARLCKASFATTQWQILPNENEKDKKFRVFPSGDGNCDVHYCHCYCLFFSIDGGWDEENGEGK